MEIGKIKDVLRCRSGNRDYFFGTITSDKIKGVTFVPVIEKSPKTPLKENLEEGYQRPGSSTRMNRFRDFLKNNPESLVPPVLLSGRGEWIYEAYDDDSPIGTINIHGPAAILDGQHRIGGYVELFLQSEDVRNIDFLLLGNLSRDEEIKEFVTVNNTQMGVPKSLGIHIGSGIEGLENILKVDKDGASIAWSLNIREDSPFLGRISRTRMSSDQLFNLASVAKNVERMFKDGAFEGCDVEEKLEITIKYWNLIADLHPKEWLDIEKLGVKGQGRAAFEFKILELTGFIAWSLIADKRILSTSYNGRSRTMDWERVERMIEILSSNVDWSKDGEYAGLTGEVGGPRINKAMQSFLSEHEF